RDEHIRYRSRSGKLRILFKLKHTDFSAENEQKSLVAIIFEEDSLPDIDEEAHAMAAEYLSIQLSMRDREEIMRVLCKSNPDLLTQLVRELVDAYEPVIRRLHNAVDLAASITDTENFMNDLVKLLKSSKPGKKEEKESQSP